MSKWIIDTILRDDDEAPQCVLEIEKEDIIVRVMEHACPELPSGVGYIIEASLFSDLRGGRQVIATVGDADLGTVISLLAEAANELYRWRATGSRKRP